MLFRMKVFAIGVAKKHDLDVQLIKEYYQRFQNREYQNYLEHYLDAISPLKIGSSLGSPARIRFSPSLI